MVGGNAGPLTRAVRLIAVGACVGCSAPEPRALVAGDSAPAAWIGGEPDRPVLAWVFTGDDILGCRSAAADLRRLQARAGQDFRLVLVYVGDRPQWVKGFARRERLRADVLGLGGREYGERFGAAPLPAYYFVHRGIVADVLVPEENAPHVLDWMAARISSPGTRAPGGERPDSSTSQ